MKPTHPHTVDFAGPLPEFSRPLDEHFDEDFGLDSKSRHASRRVTTVIEDGLAWLNYRHGLKHVEASENILRVYHESFLFGKIPISTRIRAALRNGLFDYIWRWVEALLAILSGVAYVYSTYKPNARWVEHVQDSISAAFAADYFLRLYSEPLRLHYLLSRGGLIDLLSIIPIVCAFRHNHGSKVIHLLQFLRIVRVFIVFDKIGMVGSSVRRQIFLLVISTIGAVFIDAGIFHWLEYTVAPKEIKDNCPPEGCVTFWQAVYFVVVTVSTVGYGDISPKTRAGKALVIITIFAAMTVIPVHIGGIVSLAISRPYGRSFNQFAVLKSRYLIVSGNINLRIIQSFLDAFYCPSHLEDLQMYPLHVVILAPFSPSFEIKQLLTFYGGQVEFFEGSPTQASDLERISANQAAAFFLFADHEFQDTTLVDRAQVFRALSVSKFCEGRVRVIVEVVEPETQNSAVWQITHAKGIEVVCATKLHNKIIARSCIIKGLYTLLTNIFSSGMKLQNIPLDHFMYEYCHSFQCEVYPLIFPNVFHDLLYEEVAEFLYRTFNVVLFALDIPSRTYDSPTRRKALLHPKGHVIEEDDVGIVIAESLHLVQSITKFHGNIPKLGGLDSLESIITHWEKIGTVATLRRQTVEGADRYLDGSHPSYVPGSPMAQKKLKTFIEALIKDSKQESEDKGKSSSPGSQHPAGFTKKSFPKNEKGLFAGQSTSALFKWPSLDYGRPHVAVLEQNETTILENLEERTLLLVSLRRPHILVCCQGKWPAHIFYFLLELRKPKFANPPIVMLGPNQPTAKEWGSMGIFNDVFFVQGAPTGEVDLVRAGILQAEKVVIFSYAAEPIDASGTEVSVGYYRSHPGAYKSDVDAILTMSSVEKLLGGKTENVIVEMQETTGFRYLWPHFNIAKTHIVKDRHQRNPNVLSYYVPAYMEGRAVSMSLLNFLVRSTFYNGSTLSIVEQLVAGGFVETSEGMTKEHPRVLEQIDAPEKYWGRHYEELFIGLLCECGMLALGLYRVKGTLNSPTPYVFAHPPRQTVVNQRDLVYVLL